jgi:rRNA maturation RNase YbeY
MVNIEVLSGVVSEQIKKDIIVNVPKIIDIHGYEMDEINVVFGDDNWLLELNRDYLNHDYYTDVITFDYTNDKIISGDVCVSLDRVYDNAKDFNVPRETELLRVVFHGILHLCGFKDKSELDQQRMRQAEEEALNLL